MQEKQDSPVPLSKVLLAKSSYSLAGGFSTLAGGLSVYNYRSHPHEYYAYPHAAFRGAVVGGFVYAVVNFINNKKDSENKKNNNPLEPMKHIGFGIVAAMTGRCYSKTIIYDFYCFDPSYKRMCLGVPALYGFILPGIVSSIATFNEHNGWWDPRYPLAGGISSMIGGYSGYIAIKNQHRSPSLQAAIIGAGVGFGVYGINALNSSNLTNSGKIKKESPLERSIDAMKLMAVGSAAAMIGEKVNTSYYYWGEPGFINSKQYHTLKCIGLPAIGVYCAIAAMDTAIRALNSGLSSSFFNKIGRKAAPTEMTPENQPIKRLC